MRKSGSGKSKNMGKPVYALFKNYFEGTASDRERRIVETWSATGDKEDNPFVTEKMVEEDRVRVYRRLSRQFGFRTKGNLTGQKNRKLRWVPRMTAAASVLVVVGISGWLLLIRPWNTEPRKKELVSSIFTGNVENTDEVIFLKDSSYVHLNRGTKLYLDKKKFNKKDREVWIEGEAFFDVAKNPDRPFIIHSGEIEVLVRGTSFIVKAYQELNDYTVSVRTGKVEVLSGGQTIAMLKPDKQLLYHAKSGEFETKDINWDEVAAWRNGKLVFSNAGFDELKLRLYQNFGVRTRSPDDALRKVELNAIFPEGTTLREVMENISVLYNVRYTIDDEMVTIYK